MKLALTYKADKMTGVGRAVRAIDPLIQLLSALLFVLGFAVLLGSGDRSNIPGMVTGLAMAFIGHSDISRRQVQAPQRRINRLETELTAGSEDRE